MMMDQTSRPVVVQWTPGISGETLEAEDRIQDLVGRGFGLIARRTGEAVLEPPALNREQGIIRELSQNGDDVLVWNRRNAAEVRDAANRFRKLRDAGYRFYAARADGERGRSIDVFDPMLTEIIAVPADRRIPG